MKQIICGFAFVVLTSVFIISCSDSPSPNNANVSTTADGTTNANKSSNAGPDVAPQTSSAVQREVEPKNKLSSSGINSAGTLSNSNRSVPTR